MYPEYIEIDNKKYKINTDYRVALSCFKAINDDSLNETERAMAIVVLLLGNEFPFELYEKALEKLIIYLQCGRTNDYSDEEIDVDYEQDKGYLMASFMSCYHINIAKENLHWWAYNDLIAGFGEQEVMTRVRELRNCNPYDYKDPKEREKLIKAKKQVELKRKKTEKEQEIDKMWEEMLKKGD